MLDGMASGDVFGSAGRANVVALSWQWDETSQWVAARIGHKFEKEASSHAKVAMQIMMQHGEIYTFRTDHGAQAVRLRREPWFARGLQLTGLSSDQLLDGVVTWYAILFRQRCRNAANMRIGRFGPSEYGLRPR